MGISSADEYSSPHWRLATVSLPSSRREYAEAGGLMSYGTSLPEAFRMTGLYTARILKGAKPATGPVSHRVTLLRTPRTLEVT
jgi:ABC-type uncharacterized transport system substrate-binding protein